MAPILNREEYLVKERARAKRRYYFNLNFQRNRLKNSSRKRRMRKEVRIYQSMKFREYWKNIRIEILIHYSGGDPKCAKCGFNDVRALCIDHINNDGYAERKRLKKSNTAFYKMLKENNYPARYQVLCHNCNFIKRAERLEGEYQRTYGKDAILK